MTASAPEDAKLRRLLLSRRLETFALGSSLALAPSFASIFVLLAMSIGTASDRMLLVWAVAAAVLISARIAVGRRVTPAATELTTLARQWRAVNIVLMLNSAAWAIGLPLAAWLAPGAEAYAAFAIVGAALFGGAMLMHRTAPGAALVHVVSLGSGLALAEWLRSGWQTWPVLALIAIYAVTLIGAIRVQEKMFCAACQAELDRRESEKTVRMLLNDHEAQGADWLWTIDAGGCLRDVSDRLAAVLQNTPDALEGQDFISLLEPGRERDRIAALVAQRSSFRDEPAPVDMAGERRVTYRP